MTTVGKWNTPSVRNAKRLVRASPSNGKIVGRIVLKSIRFMLSGVYPFLESPASSWVSPLPSFRAPNVNFPLRSRGDSAPEDDSSLV